MYGRRGLFWQIEDYPYGYSTPFQLFDAAKGSRSFVQKLSLHAKLPVHNGCVNTICWNDAGTHILSGSDDQHLCITNGYSHEIVADIRTGHTANIFSAKFLPNTGDHLVVSCSGDGVIAYSDVERPETSLHNLWTCHFGTAYEIATVPNDPHSFLSCGEDGTVRWFDLRTKNCCCVDDCKEDILINCHRAVTSISVNPLTPYHLAVGCSDSTVRVFDRRMLGTRAMGNYMGNSLEAMVSRFTVPEFEGRGHRITSLTYSSNGREMLVSYSSDYIYLFDARDDGQANTKIYGASPQASCASTDGKPRDSRVSMKRLRVRGDWSDTGPNARPEREMRAASGEQQPRSLHASLMQRMSDVLTRMFNTTMSRNRTALSLSSSSSASSAQSAGESSTDDEADAPASRQSRRARIARVLQQKFRQRMANKKQEAARASAAPHSGSDAASSSAMQSNPVALDLTQASTSTSTQAAHGLTLSSEEAENPSTAACNLCNRHCAELMVHLHYSGRGTNSGLITMDMSDHSSTHPPVAPPPTATAVSQPRETEDEDAIFHDSVENISESDCFQSAAENVSQMDDASSDVAPDVRVSASAERELVEAEDAMIEDDTAPFVMSIGSLSVDNTSEDEGERGGESGRGRRQRRSSDTSHQPNAARANRTRSRTQNRVSDSVLRAMAEELRLQKEENEEADQEIERVPQPRVKKRYMGHRNSRTMIKEATFWGNDFVMSGSDCGHIFIWDKETCDLVMIMEADHHVVNCLQPHPFDPILASSGIDYDIKLWAPLREEPFFDAEKAAEMIKRNEVMLEETKDTITVPASFMIRMLASLNHLRSAGGGIPGWRRTAREGHIDDSDSSNH